MESNKKRNASEAGIEPPSYQNRKQIKTDPEIQQYRQALEHIRDYANQALDYQPKP